MHFISQRRRKSWVEKMEARGSNCKIKVPSILHFAAKFAFIHTQSFVSSLLCMIFLFWDIILFYEQVLQWINPILKLFWKSNSISWSTTNALWQSCNMGEKAIIKQSTLEIDFSVNFHRRVCFSQLKWVPKNSFL